jgi:hypothetical protein
VLGSREARETVNSQLDRAVPYIGILTASEAGPRAQFTTEADHALGMIGQMAAERAERSGRGERVRAKDVAYAIGRLARAAAWGNPEVAEQLPLLAGLVGQARRDGFIDPDSIAPNVQPNLKLVLGTQSIIRALNAALPQERQHRQLEAASGHWLRFFVAGKLRRVTHSLTRIVRGVQNLLPARNAQVHTIVGRLRRAFPLPA